MILQVGVGWQYCQALRNTLEKVHVRPLPFPKSPLIAKAQTEDSLNDVPGHTCVARLLSQGSSFFPTFIFIT